MEFAELGAVDEPLIPAFVSSPPLAATNSVRPDMPSPARIPHVADAPTIIVFDSGVGGLTVLRELLRVRPDARFLYVADDALFPYGALEEGQLIARVTDLISALVQSHQPDLVVIACNTASTIVMPALRARFAIPFVGIVPAIKPACAASISKRVSVLGTEGTVKREYTRGLIRQFAQQCQVTLVGSPRLAAMAEAELTGIPAEDEAIQAEIEPCFVDDGARTDTVVLACTHYPLLLARFEALAPWPVRWINPAPAIARRVVDLLGLPSDADAVVVEPEIIFTSGRLPSPALCKVFSPTPLPSSSAKADDPVNTVSAKLNPAVFIGCPPEPVLGLTEGQTRVRA